MNTTYRPKITYAYRIDESGFERNAYPTIGLLGFRRPKNDPTHPILYYDLPLVIGERLAYNLTFSGASTNG